MESALKQTRFPNNIETPSQCPGGTFSLSGDETFYRNSNGNRKCVVSSSKMPMEMVLECNFLIQFQMGVNYRAISTEGLKFQGFSIGDDFLSIFPDG